MVNHIERSKTEERPQSPSPTISSVYVKAKSNGGPSSYYDFPHGAVTWNDVAEIKAQAQWGAFSYHMKDIGKAIMRFGAKDGTTNAYDARKIIYSGLRLLGMIEGKDAMRKELLDLLDDPQFKA